MRFGFGIVQNHVEFVQYKAINHFPNDDNVCSRWHAPDSAFRAAFKIETINRSARKDRTQRSLETAPLGRMDGLVRIH